MDKTTCKWCTSKLLSFNVRRVFNLVVVLRFFFHLLSMPDKTPKRVASLQKPPVMNNDRHIDKNFMRDSTSQEIFRYASLQILPAIVCYSN